MFESLQVNGRKSLGERLLALLVSIFLHGLMIVVLVILPLVFLHALPEQDLLTILIADPVPPPPLPPPTPPRPEGVIKAARPVTLLADWNVPPESLPKGIPLPTTEPPVIGILTVGEGIGPGLAGIPDISGAGIHSSLLNPAGAPAALPPPPAPKQPPVVIGGNVLEAKLIRKVVPEYPQLALKARVSGEVRLEVTLNEEGNVIDVKVLQGNPLLVAEAIRAVRQWKYSPTLLNGEPVRVNSSVTVVFQLKR